MRYLGIRKARLLCRDYCKASGLPFLVQDGKCDVADDVEETEVEAGSYEVLGMELFHRIEEECRQDDEGVAVQRVQEKAFPAVQHGNRVEEHQVDESDEEDEDDEAGCENLEAVLLDAEQPFLRDEDAKTDEQEVREDLE